LKIHNLSRVITSSLEFVVNFDSTKKADHTLERQDGFDILYYIQQYSCHSASVSKYTFFVIKMSFYKKGKEYEYFKIYVEWKDVI